MDTVQSDPLFRAALAVRDHAIALHSGVKVGAALETADGAIVTGCNVESPSIIVHICAERAALIAALGAGHRTFHRIAVVGDFRHPIPPCGFCRQALVEFAPDLLVTMATVAGASETLPLRDLLPRAYDIRDRADKS
ncbi:MAG: cytidine deaminase [Deltaproteobacteria bacterium]|nr:cytidine deaminase [Deltaproteobacteria bacterium]